MKAATAKGRKQHLARPKKCCIKILCHKQNYKRSNSNVSLLDGNFYIYPWRLFCFTDTMFTLLLIHLDFCSKTRSHHEKNQSKMDIDVIETHRNFNNKI